MKRIVPVALLAASVVLVLVVSASAGPSGQNGNHQGGNHGGKTIAVVEHATTDAVTNGTAGDDAGNILTFANDVYNSSDTKKVGTDQGYCIRVVVGESLECNWTTILKKGQITVEGPFYDTGDSVLAITGGTGKYRNARGEMELKYHDPQGTKFDFIFHVVG